MNCRRLWRGAVPAAVFFVLVLSGCSDDACGPCGEGRIVGRVLGGNGPVDQCNVYVKSANPSIGNNFTADCVTDSAGRFDIPLPAGGYILSVRDGYGSSTIWYSTSKLARSSYDADTLRVVVNEETPANFALGGLEIRLNRPEEFIADSFRLSLEEYDSRARMVYQDQESDLPQVEFSFRALPPDSYLAYLDLNSSDPRYSGSGMWLPPTLISAAARLFVVKRQETTSWEGTLVSPGIVSGTVDGCWMGLGLREPSITTYSLQEKRLGSCVVDAQGDFNIAVFAPGQVRLWLSYDGTYGWVGGDNFNAATAYPIESGITTHADTIRVTCVAVRLVPQPEWPSCTAGVRLYRAGVSFYSDGATLRNEETKVLQDFGSGNYELWISPYGRQVWRPQWYDRSSTREGATPIVVENVGDLVWIDVLLEEGGRISGRVLEQGGQTAANLPVTINGMSIDWSSANIWGTEPDGTFLMEGLPDGDFKIKVRYYVDDVITNCWYPGTTNEDSAAIITILDAGEVTGIEWPLCH